MRRSIGPQPASDNTGFRRLPRSEVAAEFVLWTTAEEVISSLTRRWARGDLLAAYVGQEARGPLSVTLRHPSPGALRDYPDEVKRWVRALEDGSRAQRGFGYDILWAGTERRRGGELVRVPTAVVVQTIADAVRLIGKAAEAERFQELARQTLESCSGLRGWLAKNAMRVLRWADDWDRLLALVAWFQAHPASKLYLRQIDVPGVDLTFIGRHRRLLTELLDEVLPADSTNRGTAGSRLFEERYGLLSAPRTLRLRLLDHGQTVGGFTDIRVPASQLASVPQPCARIFVTESEVNGLAFPESEDSLVLFGPRREHESIGSIEWLRNRTVYYWGDIDASGFAHLNRLRAVLPDVRSFLMDRETLLAHQGAWAPGSYKYQSLSTFGRLTDEERALLGDLIDGRFGTPIRLDQERVSYRWLRSTLDRLSS